MKECINDHQQEIENLKSIWNRSVFKMFKGVKQFNCVVIIEINYFQG